MSMAGVQLYELACVLLGVPLLCCFQGGVQARSLVHI